MCKVFIYLSDVDETAGPFIYVKGSAMRGTNPAYRTLFPQKKPLGSYPNAEDVRKELAAHRGTLATLSLEASLTCEQVWVNGQTVWRAGEEQAESHGKISSGGAQWAAAPARPRPVCARTWSSCHFASARRSR